MRQILLILCLLLSLVVSAHGEAISSVKSHEHKTFTLQAGDTLSIMGSHADIVVLGAAKSISIMGSHCSIRIDAAVSSVSVMGSHARGVVVRRKGRPEPNVSTLGSHPNVIFEDAEK